MRALVAFALLALASCGAGTPVYAHQAMSGWSYEYACCGMNDCAPLKPEQVKATRNGYVITIPPGSHPQVLAGAETLIATSKDCPTKPPLTGRLFRARSIS